MSETNILEFPPECAALPSVSDTEVAQMQAAENKRHAREAVRLFRSKQTVDKPEYVWRERPVKLFGVTLFKWTRKEPTTKTLMRQIGIR